MEIIKLTLGQLQSNTYILKKNNQVLIIDPGSEFNKIKKNIKEDEDVVAILLTHGHVDHVGAVNEVVQEYGCDVYVDQEELELLNDSSMSFYNQTLNVDFKFFKPSFKLNGFDIIIHNTPGHTKGSILIEIEDYLFTGDTLFNLNIGRMDFPTGSEKDMIQSLKYISTFTKDYTICPGHGSDSTLYFQFENNPYFK